MLQVHHLDNSRSQRVLWLLEEQEFSAADIQLSFPIQAARLLYGLDEFPNLARFLTRAQARPAYERALERGGPSIFG